MPAALVGRRLTGAAANDGAEIHLLEIDIDAGAAHLLGANARQLADPADIGRRDDHERLALVAGLGQCLLRRGMIARPLQHLDAGLVGERRAGREDADAVIAVGRVLAGQRDHRLILVDRGEQRAPHRRVVEWRIELVEAQNAHGRHVMRDACHIAVARNLREQIARRRLPPIDLAPRERRLGRKRIERQPFDPIEMRDFWPGGKTGGARRAAAVTRPVLLEARKGGAGAADMLVEEIAVGAAADDLLDGLVRRRRGEPLRHDRGHRAARPGQGCRQMRKGPFQAKFHGAVVGRR